MKMTAPVRFILLVIGIVIAAAALMAPRRDEWLAVLRDQDKQAQIIALLEPRLAAGDNDPDLLATLGRCYAETGNYPRAIELLNRYIALRPNDSEAYGRLADLFKSTGDVPRQIAMLERSIELAPKLSRVADLAAAYRQQKSPDQELALLSEFEADLKVKGGLLLRLAELRANTGDREGAIRVLTRPDIISASMRSTSNVDERLLLAKLLVAVGRSGEAVRLGKQWILQWHEAWLADRLLRGIVLQAPVSDASELADAVVALHPEVRLFLAHGLTAMGAKPVARHLLETWPQANPSASMNEIAGFLSISREQDDPAIVWQAFADVLRHPSSIDLVTHYTEAIAAEFGIGALAPFWASLPQAVIERRPLLIARLAFHEHNLALTKWLLGKVDLGALGTSDRRMWIDLLGAVTSPAEMFEVLRDRRRNGDLPPDLLPKYTRLAGGLGREMEYRAALGDLRARVK